jgi:beta-galactosidase
MRERLLFDFGWKFFAGEIPFPEPKTHFETYSSVKAGLVLGAAAPSFDDSHWTSVDLPHDGMIEQAHDPEAPVSSGYLKRGVSWYRRTFLLDPADAKRHLSIEFDGAFRHAKVWLNGHYLGQHASGYTGFDFPISDVVCFGGVPNVLVVRVDSRDYEGWWYEGCGIYRHAWLVKTGLVHVPRCGVFVRPSRVSGELWRVGIETELQNEDFEAGCVEVVSRIIAPDGGIVATSRSDQELAAKARALHQQETDVEKPKLWSLDKPALYVLRTTLREGGKIIDQVETTFGFRELLFTADKGFFLNGEYVPIQGTCNHQDHAGVGNAVPDMLIAWRLRQLKKAGCNAYRASHHPPTPELLDACDREGILVLDENRYLRSSPQALDELEDMVRRDRNHPCIVLWSICNEEFIQGSEIGGRIAATQVARVKQLDPTRPVTGALLSTGFGRGIEDQSDVVAVNYTPACWDGLHERHPRKALLITETTAAVTTRGIYEENAAAGYCDAYDRMFCPSGTTVRESWLAILQRPFIAGGFVWTGFDYRGEPGPYTWPSTGVHLGFLDLCGFPKDSFYLYQAFWTKEPMVHLLPHWNWTGREGKPIRVVAYSNCDVVELYLNGKSLGEQMVPEDHAVEWQVPYQPGTLRAEARRHGSVAASTERITSGAPAGIRFKVEPATLRANAEDVSVIAVEIVDAQGRLIPTANVLVKFDIQGPGRIIGVGNGNPNSHESDKAKQRTTFSGLAQVLAQSTDQPGEIILSASVDGLASAEWKINSEPTSRRPFVPVPSHVRMVAGWRRSPNFDADKIPDPSGTNYDPKTWQVIEPHHEFPNFLNAGQGLVYHAVTTLPAGKKCRLGFSRVFGKGAVYLDGKPAYKIHAGDPECFSLDLPENPKARPLQIDVKIEAVYGGGGLNGWVWIYTA